jgi:hypothetical protein
MRICTLDFFFTGDKIFMKLLQSVVKNPAFRLFPYFTFIALILIMCPNYSYSLEVRNSAGLMSIKADNDSLVKISDQISKKFRIYIKVYPEMMSRKVTVRFNRIAMVEGLKQVYGENYAIVTKGDKIESVHVLNRGKNYEKRNILIEKYIRGKSLSLAELSYAVVQHVKKNSTNVELVSVTPHENIEGKLQSYAFCLYTGNGKPPSEEELKRIVDIYWKQVKTLKLPESQLATSPEYNFIKNENRNFLTIEVSANYDSPPVKSFYGGIANDIAMYPNAVDLLKKNIGNGISYTYLRTFRFDPLAIGFEFEDSKKKKYYVDVLNKAVYAGWKERDPVSVPTKAPEEEKKRKERIGTQWQEFIGP